MGDRKWLIFKFYFLGSRKWPFEDYAVRRRPRMSHFLDPKKYAKKNWETGQWTLSGRQNWKNLKITKNHYFSRNPLNLTILKRYHSTHLRNFFTFVLLEIRKIWLSYNLCEIRCRYLSRIPRLASKWPFLPSKWP